MCNERNYQYPAYIVKDVSIIHQDGLPYIKVEFNNKRNELLLYERFTTMWWT